MSKIQQEKLDKIAAALDRLAADMKDVKKGVGVLKTNTPTDASINSTIKNYSFGRSLAALNVGFDLAELKVMLALFGFNNDYCSDMCKLAFFSFPLIHYNIFFLKKLWRSWTRNTHLSCVSFSCFIGSISGKSLIRRQSIRLWKI